MGRSTKIFFNLTLALLSLASYGQFDRYRSKGTKLNPRAKTQNKNFANDPKLQPSKTKDYFGRTQKKPSVKSKKYVHLNPETAYGPEIIKSFDFPNATVMEVTKHMQKLTGINLILDKGISGKISILAPTPITVGDAWQAYITTLDANGFAIVKSGSFYKIIKKTAVKSSPTKIYTGKFTPNTDAFVTKVIALKHVAASQVEQKLKQFVSKAGYLVGIAETNTLIVLESGRNINRMSQILKLIDVPGYGESLRIIPVKNSSAIEIANLLNQLVDTSTSKARPSYRRSSIRSSNNTNINKKQISKIKAEPRTNSIIALATDAGDKQLRDLIKKLDTKLISENANRIHVYYLSHSNAKSMAETLNQLISGAKAVEQKKKSSTSRFSSRYSKSNQDNQQKNTLFSSEVRITADENNNALVVTATPTDWLTVNKVIAKLDIPKDQVYVEGTIMETIVGNNNNFGVSILGATGTKVTDRIGFNTAPMAALANPQNLFSLEQLFAGFGVGGKVAIDLDGDGNKDEEVGTVNGLISALAGSSNTNVLATPQILAMDNEEAIFETGSQQPVPKTATSQNGVTTNSFEYKDVKMQLKIKPQINRASRMIRMKIQFKFDNVAKSEVAADAFSVETRLADSTVLVRDRDTIAMGGLMRDAISKTERKLPYIGDIPVLGWLFKKKDKAVSKQNLIMFLTPRILSPYQDNAADNSLDVLNRRSAHLSKHFGKEDPFASTVKGFYDKIKKQEAGPLYDLSASQKYLQENKKIND